jgi:hypothetical protein
VLLVAVPAQDHTSLNVAQPFRDRKRGLMAAYRFAPKIWDPASP